jgi:crossover junction endodeoxyribonuclease RuvC
VTRFIGIDLGLTGGAAMIDGATRDMAVTALPTTDSEAGRRLQGRELLAILRGWVPAGEPCFVTIEDIRPRPGDRGGHGNTMHSQGSLMRSRGIVEAVTDIMPAQVLWVWPAKWKKQYGLIGQDKNASRATAARMFPALAHAFARVKDDGLAEAMLLAYYGMREEMG